MPKLHPNINQIRGSLSSPKYLGWFKIFIGDFGIINRECSVKKVKKRFNE